MSRTTVVSKPVFAAVEEQSAVTKKRFLTATHFCAPGNGTAARSGIPSALFDPLQPPESPPMR